LFSSLFEEDFFFRTLGDLVRVPDVALGELVANAWDAGAVQVGITVPEEAGGTLAVEDDGSGLTEPEFYKRWMTLAYNRQKHQGSDAEFPPERSNMRRRAYGRNGQGRHALLCFGEVYEVETWRDGASNRFEVRATSGKDPFVARHLGRTKRSGHGTRLSVKARHHVPDPDRIREVLASRYLHDPNFEILVNEVSIPLPDLPGAYHERLHVEDPETGRTADLELYAIEADAGRTKHQSGVALWVGGRLVGQPGWTVLGTTILDGRTRAGRRLTFVVKTDDLYDDVLPDWTGFKATSLVFAVVQTVTDAVRRIVGTMYADRVRETTNEVLTDYRDALENLAPGDQVEVVEVAESMSISNPLVSRDVLSAAVAGVIDAKQRTAPQALVERIMSLPDEDIESLQQLLDEWSVRDALTVLDEIGRRIKVVEALEKLMDDKDIDEVHVIHPLVTQARWLFGPEYESSEYSSNSGLRAAVKKVLGKAVPASAFENPGKRPDLVIGPDSTFSAVATEDFDPSTGMASFRRILVIELKKGGATIIRKHMDQANGYVEDLLHSGHVDGSPFVHAFVVGNEVDQMLPVTTNGV